MSKKTNLMNLIEEYENSILELKKWDFKSELSPKTSELIGDVKLENELEKDAFIKTIVNLIRMFKDEKSKDDGKLYLTEIIEKEKPQFGSNNLILSPAGSGKTHFIKSLMKENSHSLFLVSTTSLKRKMVPICEDERKILSNRMYSTKQKSIYGDGNEKILVMTYSEFGENMRFSDKFAKQFPVIFCDEIHSLPLYQSYDDSSNLLVAMRYLFGARKNQVIFHFTATAEHIDKLSAQSDEIMKDVKIFNYLGHPEIKRYLPLSSYKIHGIEQVRPHLKARKESFRYFGYKAFAFCKTIESQMRLKKICEEEGFSAQAYWSVNNEEKIMNEKQIEEMYKMINEERLPDEYDVVIINSALQEGWDLKDERVKLAIINTTNETEHTQSLGRIRNDLDILVYKVSHEEEIDFYINFPPQLLNKPLDVNMKKILCKNFDLRDRQGRLLNWRTVETILKKQGFLISNEQITIDGKRKRVTIVYAK